MPLFFFYVKPSPLGEGGRRPDEGRICHSNPFIGNNAAHVGAGYVWPSAYPQYLPSKRGLARPPLISLLRGQLSPRGKPLLAASKKFLLDNLAKLVYPKFD